MVNNTSGPPKRLFYLIGVPGAGKTTLMRAVFGEHKATLFTHPFAHSVYAFGRFAAGPVNGKWIAELGAQRQKFGGTDALGMSVQPKVLDWLANGGNCINVVGEGDRLGNASFLYEAERLGWIVTVSCIVIPKELAEQRRKSRCKELGTEPQSDTWLKGRHSKITKLAPLVHPAWWLNGESPIEELAERVRQHPVFESLR